MSLRHQEKLLSTISKNKKKERKEASTSLDSLNPFSVTDLAKEKYLQQEQYSQPVLEKRIWEYRKRWIQAIGQFMAFAAVQGPT